MNQIKIGKFIKERRVLKKAYSRTVSRKVKYN